MSALCPNTFAFSPFAGAEEPPPLSELLAAVHDAGVTAVGLDAFSVAGGPRGAGRRP
ncbi:hypothetical protein [Embleya sp. NPDC050493]|uniref:hypothetical protein n=1 Tax=Embleya sp. NPDC050493 TaxID=3363989 RepID=UPI00378A0BA4